MAEHRFQMTQQRQRQFRKNSWKLRIEELEVHRIVHFDRGLLVRIIIRQMRRDRPTIRVYPRIRGVAISHGFSRSEISTGNWPALINTTRQNPRNYESSLQSLYESIDYASIIARLSSMIKLAFYQMSSERRGKRRKRFIEWKKFKETKSNRFTLLKEETSKIILAIYRMVLIIVSINTNNSMNMKHQRKYNL